MGVLYIVRHGQASFGTANYDQLSDTGFQQTALVDEHFAATGITPTSVISGGMVRQQQTAQRLAECLRAEPGCEVEVDDRWNELNAANIIDGIPAAERAAGYRQDSRVYQTVLEAGCRRWAAGEHDGDYHESFSHFTARVDAALQAALERSGSGQTTVVTTSSGVIAWVAARMVDGGFEQWLNFNRATVNAGITTIIHGSTGSTMLAYNSHQHLPKQLTTFR